MENIPQITAKLLKSIWYPSIKVAISIINQVRKLFNLDYLLLSLQSGWYSHTEFPQSIYVSVFMLPLILFFKITAQMTTRKDTRTLASPNNSHPQSILPVNSILCVHTVHARRLNSSITRVNSLPPPFPKFLRSVSRGALWCIPRL